MISLKANLFTITGFRVAAYGHGLFQNETFFTDVLIMSKDSFIKMHFLSGVQKVYSSQCACAAGRMCPLHPHTASVTLVISFYKTLPLSRRCC